jgi:hypothetical protein
MDNLQVITANQTVADIKRSAKELFLSGNVDKLEAWRNMTAFAKAVEELKKDPDVKDAALNELDKYGGETTLYGCKMERKETGVKYDYSECGDDELFELYETKKAIEADIKEREDRLKSIRPGSVSIDEETGQEFRAPHRTSTTTIQVTFKK